MWASLLDISLTSSMRPVNGPNTTGPPLDRPTVTGFQLLHPQYHHSLIKLRLWTSDTVIKPFKGNCLLDELFVNLLNWNSICKSFPESSLYYHFEEKISWVKKIFLSWVKVTSLKRNLALVDDNLQRRPSPLNSKSGKHSWISQKK